MKLTGTSASRFVIDAMRGVSEYGVKHDLPWLAYNPVLFAYFHWLARESAPVIVRGMRDEFPDAVTVIDVGAGSGAFAAEWKRRGAQVEAWEYSPSGRLFTRLQGVASRPFDLAKRPKPPRTYDLAYSLEVAEHIPESLADDLVSFLADCSQHVVFTAAQPGGPGGVGHINEQPSSYWIEKFSRVGYERDHPATDRLAAAFDKTRHKWFRDNVMVFAASA